ncbi:MAG: hypothetical protein QUS11_07245, partial [Candidatus Fermentibacter sp.]|nr:hypothetical protein [Candidatus Fermentibacter sp.]
CLVGSEMCIRDRCMAARVERRVGAAMADLDATTLERVDQRVHGHLGAWVDARGVDDDVTGIELEIRMRAAREPREGPDRTSTDEPAGLSTFREARR